MLIFQAGGEAFKAARAGFIYAVAPELATYDARIKRKEPLWGDEAIGSDEAVKRMNAAFSNPAGEKYKNSAGQVLAKAAAVMNAFNKDGKLLTVAEFRKEYKGTELVGYLDEMLKYLYLDSKAFEHYAECNGTAKTLIEKMLVFKPIAKKVLEDAGGYGTYHKREIMVFNFVLDKCEENSGVNTAFLQKWAFIRSIDDDEIKKKTGSLVDCRIQEDPGLEFVKQATLGVGKLGADAVGDVIKTGYKIGEPLGKFAGVGSVTGATTVTMALLNWPITVPTSIGFKLWKGIVEEVGGEMQKHGVVLGGLEWLLFNILPIQTWIDYHNARRAAIDDPTPQNIRMARVTLGMGVLDSAATAAIVFTGGGTKAVGKTVSGAIKEGIENAAVKMVENEIKLMGKEGFLAMRKEVIAGLMETGVLKQGETLSEKQLNAIVLKQMQLKAMEEVSRKLPVIGTIPKGLGWKETVKAVPTVIVENVWFTNYRNAVKEVEAASKELGIAEKELRELDEMVNVGRAERMIKRPSAKARFKKAKQVSDNAKERLKRIKLAEPGVVEPSYKIKKAEDLKKLNDLEIGEKIGDAVKSGEYGREVKSLTTWFRRGRIEEEVKGLERELSGLEKRYKAYEEYGTFSKVSDEEVQSSMTKITGRMVEIDKTITALEEEYYQLTKAATDATPIINKIEQLQFLESLPAMRQLRELKALANKLRKERAALTEAGGKATAEMRANVKFLEAQEKILTEEVNKGLAKILKFVDQSPVMSKLMLPTKIVMLPTNILKKVVNWFTGSYRREIFGGILCDDALKVGYLKSIKVSTKEESEKKVAKVVEGDKELKIAPQEPKADATAASQPTTNQTLSPDDVRKAVNDADKNLSQAGNEIKTEELKGTMKYAVALGDLKTVKNALEQGMDLGGITTNWDKEKVENKIKELEAKDAVYGAYLVNQNSLWNEFAGMDEEKKIECLAHIGRDYKDGTAKAIKLVIGLYK